MYEVSWYFVYSFTSYSRLSGATFAFVLYHDDSTVTHVLERWPNWTNYDSNWLLTHRILQLGLQRLSVSKPQAVAPGKEIHIEWGSHRGNRGVFRRLGRKGFRTTEKASKCWKIAIPSVSPSKATMLRNKYNFAQKTLVFIKNPGTFQPM